jgi:serine/threonine-protein kinase HipA
MSGLEVWLDEHEVGWLKPGDAAAGTNDGESRKLSLAYLERWTSEVLAFPLAPSLPLPPRGGPSSESASDAVQDFFDHLLPSGRARTRIFSALGLHSDDIFGALRLMGRDLVGAVRLFVEGRPRPAGPAQRLIPHAELSERLRDREANPFAVWDGQVRGALPGDADTLGVYVERDGGWYFVDGPQMAATHMLKPASVDNCSEDWGTDEFVCMRLAAKVGLQVAPVRLHHVPEQVLLVERIDRQVLKDGRVRRLHSINAAQALGLPVAALNGLTRAQCFGLLDQSPSPLVDRRELLRRWVFQELVGNGPTARNVSFFVDHGGLRLAPADGLVCLHLQAETVVDDDRWAALARDCGLPPRKLAQEVKRMSNLVRVQAESLVSELSTEAGAISETALVRRVAAAKRQLEAFD